MDRRSISVQLSELKLGHVSITPGKVCHGDLIVAPSLINCSEMFYGHTQGNQVDPLFNFLKIIPVFAAVFKMIDGFWDFKAPLLINHCLRGRRKRAEGTRWEENGPY